MVRRVARPCALWDSEGRSKPFPVGTVFMSTPVRTLTTVSSIVLLWLMSVSFADAAQTRHKAEGQPCDAQSTTLKKLARHSKKLGGPRRLQPAGTVVSLTGMTARFQRAT